MGLDLKPFAFNVIELLSQKDIILKRSGYLASIFCFGSPDMQLLSTNIYAKDLQQKKDLRIREYALSSLATCPKPSLIQVQTLLPLLYELLSEPTPKIIATILRLHLLSKEDPCQFVEILVKNSQKIFLSMNLTRLFVHTATELCQNFGFESALAFVPIIFNCFQIQNSDILRETIRFFAQMSEKDDRIYLKTKQQVFGIAQCFDDNLPIQLEVLRATELVYFRDEFIVNHCKKFVSKFIQKIYQNEFQIDQINQLLIILKYYQNLEKKLPGIIFQTDNLSNCVIKLINFKDFNVKYLAIKMAGNFCNREICQTVVGKLMKEMKNEKLAYGNDIKSLHVMNVSDQKALKQCIVKTVLKACGRNGYENVEDFNWFIGVLVTMMMETDYSGDCANVLIDLFEKFEEIRKQVPGLLVNIVRETKKLLGRKIVQLDEMKIKKDVNLMINSQYGNEMMSNEQMLIGSGDIYQNNIETDLQKLKMYQICLQLLGQYFYCQDFKSIDCISLFSAVKAILENCDDLDEQLKTQSIITVIKMLVLSFEKIKDFSQDYINNNVSYQFFKDTIVNSQEKYIGDFDEYLTNKQLRKEKLQYCEEEEEFEEDEQLQADFQKSLIVHFLSVLQYIEVKICEFGQNMNIQTQMGTLLSNLGHIQAQLFELTQYLNEDLRNMFGFVPIHDHEVDIGQYLQNGFTIKVDIEDFSQYKLQSDYDAQLVLEEERIHKMKFVKGEQVDIKPKKQRRRKIQSEDKPMENENEEQQIEEKIEIKLETQNSQDQSKLEQTTKKRKQKKKKNHETTEIVNCNVVNNEQNDEIINEIEQDLNVDQQEVQQYDQQQGQDENKQIEEEDIMSILLGSVQPKDNNQLKEVNQNQQDQPKQEVNPDDILSMLIYSK